MGWEGRGWETAGAGDQQGPGLTRPHRLARLSQKTATAVAHCKRGNGLIKVNGRPLEMIEPRTLQYKVLGSGTGVWVAGRGRKGPGIIRS